MRIIKIRIENFGKLSEYELELKANPHTILEDNGWGKSTLATFIRVMFYGFAGEATRSAVTNERKRYMPWNKGVYGGSIVFEINGKTYEMCRVFGNRSSEDSAMLRDYATGLESGDYRCDQLGEQLFGIDSEAFARTVFIAQDRTVNGTPGSSIQAKIGSISCGEADMGEYDHVMENIRKYRLALKSGTKKGMINETVADISEMEVKQLQNFALDKEMTEVNSKLGDLRNEASGLRDELGRLDEEIKLSSKYGERKAKREKYELIKKDLEEIRETMEANKPACRDMEMLKSMMETAKRMEELTLIIRECQGYEVTDGGVYREEVSEHIRIWKKRNDMLASVNSLQVKLDNAKQMDRLKKETVENANLRLRDKYNEDVERSARESEESQRKQEITRVSFLVLGILTAVLSIPIYFVLSTFIHMIVAGFAVAILGVYTAMKKRDDGQNNAQNIPMPVYEEYIPDSGLLEYQKEIEKLLSEACEYENRIKAYFENNSLDYDEDMVESELYRLLAKSDDISKNQDKADRYRSAVSEYEEKEVTIKDFWSVHKLPVEESRLLTLQNQKIILSQYEGYEQRYEQKAIELKEFEDSLDFDLMEEENPNLLSVEEIAGQKETINRRYEEVNEKIHECRSKLEEDSLKQQILNENRILLEEKKNHLIKLNDEYDIIVKVEEHLLKAKNNLTSRYRDPILDSFAKYYGFIQESDLDLYDIDSNISVTRREAGDKRSMETQSRGYKEMVDVALRMALVDAMFGQEKPFIVLDDPFVNLDTEKVEKCREFIDAVAGEYQVIYFTCHESRAFN